MMKKAISFALLATLASTAVAGGSTGSVEGTLVEQSTGKIAANGSVTVKCGGVAKSARADAQGHFIVDGLPEGSCMLTAAGGEFVTVTMPVTVSAGTISTLIVSVTSKEYAAKLRREEARQRAEMLKWQKENRRYRAMAKRRMDVADFDGGGGGGGWGVEGGVMGGVAGGDMPRPAPPPPRMAPQPKPASPAPKAGGGGGPNVQLKPADERVAVRGNNNGVARAPAGTVTATRPGTGAGSAGPPAVVTGAKIVVLDDAKKQEQAKRIAQQNRKAEKDIAARAAARQDNGWAMVRVFPVPEYSKNYDGPRSDFRETVYWNPTVQTNGRGEAEVSFAVSDAVTSFRASAEGFSAAGLAGGGEATIQSKLPLVVDAHLPTEVTSGDTVKLPITIANETDEPMEATLDAKFGAAFRLASNPLNGKVKIKAKDKTTIEFALEVVATDGAGDVELRIASKGVMDEVKKQIRVVPKGFPVEIAASGTAKKGEASKQVIELSGAMPGTVHASVSMYPSPVAAIASGMDGMIREPGGCFEQASSTNYPNIMILGYLDSTADGADPALIAKTKGVLDKGYKLLTGYESSEKGYEWFGQNPGHEALTAYGLMEFADMSKVYDVDKKMVERTADWLMARRDGQGGFQRNARALDSFGRASATTTNAYIMWALSEARRTQNLQKELLTQKTLGAETRDPYLLALAANTNLVAAPKASETTAMAKKLAGLQSKDGSFPGAKETITMSGGDSLTIESTALAVMALLKASPNGEFEPQIRSGVEWLNSKRGGYGAWGNTQATILGLKALTAYAEHSRVMAVAGSATLVINGKDAGTIKFEKGRKEPLQWKDLQTKLSPGKNTIEVRLDGAAQLPYTVSVDYRSTQPTSAPKAKVSVSTQLLKTQTKMGDGVTLRAHVENKTAEGIPMTLARIGLPGGTVFQTWQLKELRDKGLIDFYETRPREVILYWRALPPNAKKDVDLNLLSNVPGTYEAPASSAYLYYTAEDKAWAAPVAITIDK